jgi:hypothetical protein
MEIYKESVYDLLDVGTRNKPLEDWTKVCSRLRHSLTSPAPRFSPAFVPEWIRVLNNPSIPPLLFPLLLAWQGTDDGRRRRRNAPPAPKALRSCI